MTFIVKLCITYKGVKMPIGQIGKCLYEKVLNESDIECRLQTFGGQNMNILKLKKRIAFSLIAIMTCSTLFYSVNNIFDITGYISKQMELLKEKEMKYVYSQNNSTGDRYLQNDGMSVKSRNIQVNDSQILGHKISDVHYNQDYTFLSQYENIGMEPAVMSEFLQNAARINSVAGALEKQVNSDSYRDRKFGVYYVFSFDYTLDALQELDNSIDRISAAQKVPKALLMAVLFREMMFLGQEDLLDGLPVIGGKSMGICQIGIENVRYNEQIVHGEKSLITSEADEQIKTMLQNPKHAVYFCAVQLRARAIKLTGNHEVDLNKLNEDQLKKVLENYNLSSISFDMGPVKTKKTYAAETYRYYELFRQYLGLMHEESAK